ncbi:hypothetical protein [Paenibacillus sp. YYML68]|uniref:hypothetical protein n=1 Tax=Paenibacillus sp. YYML68 TaxID=2909250 RepID=UPI00248F5852|nr:hypothetical protein [Paenibacillus sp. YYML68]
MNEMQVIRWLGMVCIAAGITRIGMTPSAIIWGTDSPQELTFGLIACVLMSVGTIATYMVQSRETGVTGFITTLAIIVANILTTAMVWGQLTAEPGAALPEGTVVNISRLIMMIGLMGGSLLFAILTFRANVFPRWVPALLILMLLNTFLPVADNQFFAAFWGIAYVGMGYCIWTGKLRPSVERQSQSLGA